VPVLAVERPGDAFADGLKVEVDSVGDVAHDGVDELQLVAVLAGARRRISISTLIDGFAKDMCCKRSHKMLSSIYLDCYILSCNWSGNTSIY
jgi:hypothetical protein